MAGWSLSKVTVSLWERNRGWGRIFIRIVRTREAQEEEEGVEGGGGNRRGGKSGGGKSR